MNALARLFGCVERGKHIGTRLGFPTANLQPDEPFALPFGVYAALCELALQGKRYFAVVNIGGHPTFPEGAPTVEAHLLDYDGGELYGQRMTLWILQFLREERRFADGEALSRQLEKDRSLAVEYAAGHQSVLDAR